MNYFLVLTICAIIIGTFAGIANSDEFMGAFMFCGILLGGTLVSVVSVKAIDYTDFGTSLKLVINEDMTNDELVTQIENLLDYESDGEVFDILIDIDDDKISNLNTKKVKLKLKLPVISEDLYITNNKDFKIVIQDKEVQNSNIELIGLGED